MKIGSLSKMPFSPDANWPELASVDPAVARMFLLLVLPLSLLPPVMIYLAGKHYGGFGLSVGGFGTASLSTVVLVFFLGEIASVTLMGWLIKQVANTWNGQVSYGKAYLLASVAPIPQVGAGGGECGQVCCK